MDHPNNDKYAKLQELIHVRGSSSLEDLAAILASSVFQKHLSEIRVDDHDHGLDIVPAAAQAQVTRESFLVNGAQFTGAQLHATLTTLVKLQFAHVLSRVLSPAELKIRFEQLTNHLMWTIARFCHSREDLVYIMNCILKPQTPPSGPKDARNVEPSYHVRTVDITPRAIEISTGRDLFTLSSSLMFEIFSTTAPGVVIHLTIAIVDTLDLNEFHLGPMENLLDDQALLLPQHLSLTRLRVSRINYPLTHSNNNFNMATTFPSHDVPPALLERLIFEDSRATSRLNLESQENFGINLVQTQGLIHVSWTRPFNLEGPEAKQCAAELSRQISPGDVLISINEHQILSQRSTEAAKQMILSLLISSNSTLSLRFLSAKSIQASAETLSCFDWHNNNMRIASQEYSIPGLESSKKTTDDQPEALTFQCRLPRTSRGLGINFEAHDGHIRVNASAPFRTFGHGEFGAAEMSGQIAGGEILESINGVKVHDTSLDEVSELYTRLEEHQHIVLGFRRILTTSSSSGTTTSFSPQMTQLKMKTMIHRMASSSSSIIASSALIRGFSSVTDGSGGSNSSRDSGFSESAIGIVSDASSSILKRLSSSIDSFKSHPDNLQKLDEIPLETRDSYESYTFPSIGEALSADELNVVSLEGAEAKAEASSSGDKEDTEAKAGAPPLVPAMDEWKKQLNRAKKKMSLLQSAFSSTSATSSLGDEPTDDAPSLTLFQRWMYTSNAVSEQESTQNTMKKSISVEEKLLTADEVKLELERLNQAELADIILFCQGRIKELEGSTSEEKTSDECEGNTERNLDETETLEESKHTPKVDSAIEDKIMIKIASQLVGDDARSEICAA